MALPLVLDCAVHSGGERRINIKIRGISPCFVEYERNFMAAEFRREMEMEKKELSEEAYK